MLSISTTFGTLSSVSVPSVSRPAASSGRAAFLAPLIGMIPDKGVPPRI
jgi:hypothetical protein